jgi:hypothetical protein
MGGMVLAIATGAHPPALLWQVMTEGGRITAIGLGLLMAVAAGRLLRGFLYGVDASLRWCSYCRR